VTPPPDELSYLRHSLNSWQAAIRDRNGATASGQISGQICTESAQPRKGKSGESEHKAAASCLVCGQPLQRKQTGRTPKYCGARCRNKAREAIFFERFRQSIFFYNA
jgi:hypothetical protein